MKTINNLLAVEPLVSSHDTREAQSRSKMLVSDRLLPHVVKATVVFDFSNQTFSLKPGDSVYFKTEIYQNVHVMKVFSKEDKNFMLIPFDQVIGID
jgi:hypothetical protein